VKLDWETLPVTGEIHAGTSEWDDPESSWSSMDDVVMRYGELKQLRVVGDSMEGAGLLPGDIVFVAPLDRLPYRFGDLVAVRVGTNNPVIKRYTPHGLLSEYRHRVVKTIFTEPAEIVGTICFEFRDRYRANRIIE
jgi:SOS-response transcriptional repressor LexA